MKETVWIKEILRRGTGNMLYRSESTCIVYDTVSRVHMASSSDADEAYDKLNGIELISLCTDNMVLRNRIAAKLGLRRIMDCYDMLYIGDKPIASGNKLSIRNADELGLNLVKANYHDIDEAELDMVNARKELYIGYDAANNAVGFIGKQLEGSIGMLKVLDEYRGNGYGSELEAFMINRALSLGETAYGQVICTNGVSLSLQQKLGLKQLEGKAYWAF